MRKWLFLLGMISTTAIAQVSVTTAEQAFERENRHFKGKTWECYPVNTVIGDLNGDKKPDALIQYHCTPTGGGGNATYTLGWAVFLNKNGKPVYAFHDSQNVPWVIDRITQDGRIMANKLDYAPEDSHCCPSIKTPHVARYKPDGFLIIK